jgi:1-deoxy-D-xylulose-5-phosphate synthase
MCLPDRFIDHDSPARQMVAAGLGVKDIVGVALAARGVTVTP